MGFMGILVHAWAEARKLKQQRVGSEHVLLGLLRHQDEEAVQLLQNLGINIEQLYQALLSEFRSNSGEDGQQRGIQALGQHTEIDC